MEYQCINCQKMASTLYTKYSEGVIRLTECEECGETVDKYIEYDTVLLVIDLMLQYIEAYRHVLNNVKIHRPARLLMVFWFSNAYEEWIRERTISNSENIYDLEWMFYKSLLSSALKLSLFVLVIIGIELVGTRMRTDRERIKKIVWSTLFGFYGNVAVVLSIVFRLSDQFSYQVVFNIFLLVSHLQVQRVIFPKNSILSNFLGVVLAQTVSILCSSLILDSGNSKIIV